MLLKAGELMPKALITLPRFIQAHCEHDAKLKNYFISKKGRRLFDAEVLEELKDRNALLFPAINRRARIAVARAADESGRAFAGRWSKPAYFVTLAPPEAAMPLSEANEFDTGILIEWTRLMLGDFQFIGAVDTALYTNLALCSAYSGPTVSWHVHLVVWGCAEADLSERIEHINTMSRSIIQGRSPAHFRKISPKQVPGRLLYALKAPLKESRILGSPKQQSETQVAQSAVIKVKKRPFRPGDAVRICKVLKGHNLLQLIFANGQGERLKRRIVADARALIQRRDQRNKERLTQLLSISPPTGASP
jgi:hypothetical protein